MVKDQKAKPDPLGILAITTEELKLRSMPVRVAYEFQFWDGLWVLIVVLRTVRISTRSTENPFPTWVRVALRNFSRNKKTSFEHWSIEERNRATHFLIWLVTDWPDRLVALFVNLRVFKSNLHLLDGVAPYWVHSVFDQFLSRRKHVVASGEVLEAIQRIEKTGRKASRIAVKQLLGVSESKAIAAVFDGEGSVPFDSKWLRRAMTLCEFQLQTCRHSKDAWAAMLRDALALALAALGNRSFQQLAVLSIGQAREIWTRPLESLSPDVVTEVKLAARLWRLRYERDVRPNFSRGRKDIETYLLTRFGEAYGCNGLPGYFADILRKIGYPHPERGCKVFADLHDRSI